MSTPKAKNIELKQERMLHNGAGKAAARGLGFQPNYLFGLDDLCRKFISKEHTVLEIGSNRGISTRLFCSYAKHVHAVDPKITPELKELTESVGNLSFSKIKSHDFFKTNTDQFDLIYIDAMHHYKAASRDIRASIPALKPTGVLAGHDMVTTGCNGILKAVNEIFPAVKCGDIVLHRFSDSSWAISAEDIKLSGFSLGK